jgi:hypothetical protein
MKYDKGIHTASIAVSNSLQPAYQGKLPLVGNTSSTMKLSFRGKTSPFVVADATQARDKSNYPIGYAPNTARSGAFLLLQLQLSLNSQFRMGNKRPVLM